MTGIRIVEIEVVVLNILRDAIDLVLRVMDGNVRIADGDDVDLARRCLLLEQRSLAHAHTDVHLGATNVVKCGFDLSAFLLNQHVELNVHIPSHGFVLSVTIKLALLRLFSGTAPRCPLLLHLLNVIDHVTRARHCVFLHL